MDENEKRRLHFWKRRKFWIAIARRDQPMLRVRIKPSGPIGASMTVLRTRDWFWGTTPFQAICTKLGLLKMNSMGLVLKSRGHLPRRPMAGIYAGVVPDSRSFPPPHVAKWQVYELYFRAMPIRGKIAAKAIVDCGKIAVNQGFPAMSADDSERT
jgi:hypothetical protein